VSGTAGGGLSRGAALTLPGRAPGTLPFVLEVAAFCVLWRQAQGALGGGDGPAVLAAGAFFAIVLPLAIRAVAGDPGGAATGTPPGGRTLSGRLEGLGLGAPRGTGRDPLVMLWVAACLIAVALGSVLLASVTAPEGLVAVVDILGRGRSGGPPAVGALGGRLPGIETLAGAFGVVLVWHGYVQSLGMRRFGPAGDCAVWVVAGALPALGGYLLGLEAAPALVWALAGLAPGPLLQAYYRDCQSVFQVVLVRAAIDAAVLPLATGFLDRDPAAAAIPCAVALAVALLALAILSGRRRGAVGALVRAAGRALGEGAALGLPLGAGLLAAWVASLLLQGRAIALTAAAAALLWCRFSAGPSPGRPD